MAYKLMLDSGQVLKKTMINMYVLMNPKSHSIAYISRSMIFNTDYY